jgi:hypothetical protein
MTLLQASPSRFWPRGRLELDMVNAGTVNGGAAEYLPAAKCAAFRVFARKSGFQKVR